MIKVVFAGGTHSGKTSLVEYFKNEGYETVPECGIAVVNSLIDELGWEGYRTWRKKNPDEFISRIIVCQIESEKEISESSDIVFFDRGILDYAAMAAHIGAAVPSVLAKYARSHPYDIVFVCDTLAKADERAGEGRFFTTLDSLKIGEHAERLYREYGYSPVQLLDIPLEERVRMVKKTLKIA